LHRGEPPLRAIKRHGKGYSITSSARARKCCWNSAVERFGVYTLLPTTNASISRFAKSAKAVSISRLLLALKPWWNYVHGTHSWFGLARGPRSTRTEALRHGEAEKESHEEDESEATAAAVSASGECH
jgi:hypothetical protein